MCFLLSVNVTKRPKPTMCQSVSPYKPTDCELECKSFFKKSQIYLMTFKKSSKNMVKVVNLVNFFKQRDTVGSSKFKKETTVHLFGTTLRCGWIRIWCTNECLWQQEGVCRIDSQQTAQCVFIIMTNHISQCNSAVSRCVYSSCEITTMELFGSEEEHRFGFHR